MEYVAHLPNTRKMLGPVVALVIGAAGAVGAYALIDDDNAGVQPARVIVTDAPAPPSEGVAAKDEAATAAAISNSGPQPSTFFGKDEAKTAAAIGNSGPQPSTFGKDEAKTAAAIGSSPLTSRIGKGEAKTPAAIGSQGHPSTPQGIPSPAAAEAMSASPAPVERMSGPR
jgi:hypothetical protein